MIPGQVPATVATIKQTFKPATIFNCPMENSLNDTSTFGQTVKTSFQYLNSTFRAAGSNSSQFWNGSTAGETTGYVSYNYHPSMDIGQEDFSVSLWFYARGTHFILFTLNSLTVSGTNGFGLTANWRSGSYTTTGTNPVIANEWNHIVVARRVGVMKVIVNGVTDGTFACSGSISGGQGFQLGRNGGYANGTGWATTLHVDDVVIERGFATTFNDFGIGGNASTLINRFDGAAGVQRGNSFRPNVNSTMYGTAVLGSAEIPKDGRWYYWEASLTGTGTGGTVICTQTSSQAPLATVSFASLRSTTTGKGTAVKWVTNQYYRMHTDVNGNLTGAPISLGTGVLYAYPAAYINNSTGWVTMLLRSTQMVVPNIAAYNAGALYQGATVAAAG